MSDKTIWLVVKRWPGGAWNYEAGYTDEESARYAASRIISDKYMVTLETVPLGDSVTEVLPNKFSDVLNQRVNGIDS